MKTIGWTALACASLLLAGCPQDRQVERLELASAKPAIVRSAIATPASTASHSVVTLTLDTLPFSAQVTQGEPYNMSLRGTWQRSETEPVYLQASDSAGTLLGPAPNGPYVKSSNYHLGLALPTSTAVGTYSGTLTVRACADALCTQPYANASRSIPYSLEVVAVGDWETLQRTSRHDGHVPVQIDAARYQQAWTWLRPTGYGPLSSVVTHGDNVYFTEQGASAVRALRASDGAPQWRREFSSASFSSLTINPPTVSNGIVYVTTTGHQDTWLYALRASDGLQAFRSQFLTQWAEILNPTVRNGKVYVAAGFIAGVVYAFDIANGNSAWNASGGTHGGNTPAVDDEFAYVHNGGTLNVLRVADGSLARTIGPNPEGVTSDYHGTPMLGSADHVLAFSGMGGIWTSQRQLLDYSVASGSVRWMSNALYMNYPAVANGVVYAASNETGTFDALDEATGRVLWSWKPAEPGFSFIGNVVVTDNVAFVSTDTRIYAIELRKQRVVWSAATPGTMSISADRMLFVSSPGLAGGESNGRITAYRLN